MYSSGKGVGLLVRDIERVSMVGLLCFSFLDTDLSFYYSYFQLSSESYFLTSCDTMFQAEVAESTKMRVNDSLNSEKPPKPRNNSGNSERPRSNRSSLIITHEDGTTEESECVVTSLGFSHENSDSISIEEIGQSTNTRSMPYNEARVTPPEIVTVEVHRDPELVAPILSNVVRDHSPLLEIETLPNSPSPCFDKMSSLSLSPITPLSPSISLSPSPRSSFTCGSVSPESWSLEASRPSDYQAQLSDRVDSRGAQTVGGGQTEWIIDRDTLKVEEDKRTNKEGYCPDKQQRKNMEDEWEMVRSVDTELHENEDIKKSFTKKVIQPRSNLIYF